MSKVIVEELGSSDERGQVTVIGKNFTITATTGDYPPDKLAELGGRFKLVHELAPAQFVSIKAYLDAQVEARRNELIPKRSFKKTKVERFTSPIPGNLMGRQIQATL